MDYTEIAEILVGGKVSMQTFTVPEGLTVNRQSKSWSIRAWVIRLYSRTSLKIRSGSIHMNFFIMQSDVEAMKKICRTIIWRAICCPNTYYVAEGSSEEEIINTMLRQF